MRPGPLLLLVGGLLLLPWLAGSGLAQTLDRIVAVVGEKVITHSEVDTTLRPLLRRLRASGERANADTLWKRALDELINRRVRSEKAKEYKIIVSDADVDGTIKDIAARNNMSVAQMRRALANDGVAFDAYRDEVKDKLLSARLIQKLIRPLVSVSQEELRQMRSLMEVEQKRLATQPAPTQVVEQVREIPVEIKIGHIMLALPPNASADQVRQRESLAKEIAGRLRKGESFATLASQHSDDPSGANGGEMGWFKKGEMMPEVEAAMFSMPKGAFVGPLRSSTGFHLFKVLDQKTVSKKTAVTVQGQRPQFRPVSEISDSELENLAAERKSQAHFQQWMRQQRQLTYVEYR